MAVHWTDYPERVEKFGDLLNIRQTLENDNADNVFTFESFARESDTSAYRVHPSHGSFRIEYVAERMPGITRLEDVATRDHGYGLSAQVLKQLRVRAAAVLREPSAAVDEMTIEEVADALDLPRAPDPQPIPLTPTGHSSS